MNEEKIINETMATVNGNTEIPGDPPVYYTQVWLNQTYGYHTNWITLAEDGITGWGTINGLIRALQIYLGVTVDADFGNGTKTAFQNKYSSSGGILYPVLNTSDNIYGIITGALWCKGYYGSYNQTVNAKIDSQGTASLCQLKGDAGLNSDNSCIDALLLKALLSMDQFVLLSNYGGKSEIRAIQQYLNTNYIDYVGIVPCDGLFQRDMNKALIKVLQYVEGYRGNNVDGVFGNGTKNNLPQLSSSNQPAEAVRLFNFCLTCNGYSISGTTWNENVETKTKAFQAKHLIPENGLGDTNTWMALLLSKGNTNRSSTGCDCSTILDTAKATALYNAGYRVVGRYLSGNVGSGASSRPKNLSKTEMDIIFEAGLRIFAIYQEGGVYLERYTYEQGLLDAEKAITAATSLGVPMREYIYFTVDYDVMDTYIASYVVPYFTGINEVMASYGNPYHIGIYGSRNVCSRISFEFGLASSSFVSDMSTGYSGNMGFALPDNWAFDQFHEFSFSGNGQVFPLDKDAVSGRYLGFDHYEDEISGDPEEITEEEMLDAAYSIMLPVLTETHLGPRISFSWESPPIVVSVPPVTIKVSFKHSTLFSLGEDNAQYGTFNITNGVIEGVSWSETESLFDSIDLNLKSNIGFNDWASVLEMTQSINNGKISIGTKLTSDGKLSAYFVVEQYIGTSRNPSATVSVKFEFILDDVNITPNKRASFSEAMVKVAEVVAVAVVAAGVVYLASTATVVVGGIASFFTSLFSWIAAIFA